MQNIFIDILPPWVETGLQPAFYDLESGTVLQQTARMYAKVRELTEAFNQFSEDVSNEINSFEQETNDEIERFEGVINDTVEEYIGKFNDLHDYVEDYFENLDVQEEINNKLDDMVEDGTLQEIITTYIQSNVAWTFDSVSEMASATNLIAGSYAQTYGYYSVNDGGGAKYYITDTASATDYQETLSGGLYATLIVDKGGVNVKQFGAKGDDTADDSTAFQNAIDYVQKDGTIYVPTGKYKISTTLTTNCSISIIGCDDVPTIIYTGNSKLFSILGHPNENTEYETKPRNSSSELKPILKQLCLTTGLTQGLGKTGTTAISFDTTATTIMARSYLENVQIWHFETGVDIGKYHFYLMNFTRPFFSFNDTAIKTNPDRVDSGEKISIIDGLFENNGVCINFTGPDYDMNIINTSLDFNKCFLYASGNVLDDSRKIVIDGCHYETDSDDYVYNVNDPHGFIFGLLQGTSVFISNTKFSTRSADKLFFAAGKSGGTYVHFNNNRIEFKAGYYQDVEAVPYLYYFNSDENFIVTAKNNDSTVFTIPLTFHQAINSTPGIAYPYANGTATVNAGNLIVDSASQVTDVYIQPDTKVNVASYNITAKNTKTGYKGLQFIPTDTTQAVQVVVSEGTMTPLHDNETKRVCLAVTNCSKVEYQIAYFNEAKTRTHTDTYYTSLENNTIEDTTLVIPHCPAINKTNTYTTDRYIKVYARLTGIVGKTPELDGFVVYTI